MALILVLIILLVALVPHTKFLSLESRGVLMVETMKLATEHPISLLVGAGPDSLIQTFSTQRSDRINAYFPSDMAIDSSHNVIIDFLYSYGILLTFGLGILFFRRFSTLDSTYRHIVTLSLLFFSLNVIVIAPLIVTLFILASPPRIPAE